MQPRPICLNIVLTLLMDEPANNMAIDNNKFPEGILVFFQYGWLLHMFSCPHDRLEHVALTTTMDPFCLVIIRGLSALHKIHILNNRSNCDKKTMCFGASRSLSPVVRL